MLSERLKQLRLERGLTQKEMSLKIGKSESGYRQYEISSKGSTNPQLETLVILADFFGVSIDYLVGRSDYRNIESVQPTFKTNNELIISYLKQQIELLSNSSK